MKTNLVVKLKCIGANAIQYITCGHKQAICGEFRCLERVKVSEVDN